MTREDNPYYQILNQFYDAVSKNFNAEQLYQFLEHNVLYCQYLMGIGSGSAPESSGEKIIFNLLKKLRRKEEPLCIFDVGANKGQYTSQIKQGLQGIPSRIHVFEPSYHSYRIIFDRFKDDPNTKLNNIGLGKHCGESNLFFDEMGSGLASLYKRRLDHFGITFKQSEKVKIDTLDAYCLNNQIQYIDLLKLDVEGHELEVLQGGLKMINRQKIGMISFEFGGCNIDSKTYFQDFYYFFHENGMNRIFRITPFGYLAPVDQYKEIYEQFRTTNYLVIRGSVTPVE